MKPFPFGAILGEFEQLVLLALLRLGNGAFGAAIHREIVTRTGRDLPGERRLRHARTARRQAHGRARMSARRRRNAADGAASTTCSTPPASAPSSRAYRTFGMMTAGLQDELEDLTQRMWPGAAARTPPRHTGW